MPEAIRAAFQVAAQTASYDRTAQVAVNEPGRGRAVIRDSTSDGFSGA